MIIRKQYSVLSNTDKGRREHPAFICIILPQTSIPSSDINHPDIAESIMQVFLMENLAQLVAHDFRATNLRVDIGEWVPVFPAVDVAQALSSLSNIQVTH